MGGKREGMKGDEENKKRNVFVTARMKLNFFKTSFRISTYLFMYIYT